MAMRNITAAQWDAVAWAQGSFGVPDTAIAKIINCSSSTVRNARVKGGWDVRDLTKAHSSLTGWRQAEGRSNPGWGKRQLKPEVDTDPQQRLTGDRESLTDEIGLQCEQVDSIFPSHPDAKHDEIALETAREDATFTLQRLTVALSRELSAAATSATPDIAALKRVDGLVAAAKALEKLMALGPKAAEDPFADEEALAVEERVRLLGQMDKRVEELAEQRAQEIRNERSEVSTN